MELERTREPAPHNRKREEGEPAYLKPLRQLEFLPALLTVLSAIPQPREALLARHNVQDDYPYKDSWWAGDDIGASVVTFNEQDQEVSHRQSANQTVVMEVQRLMAFLDKTTRAYGSAQPLAGLDSLRISKETSDVTLPLHVHFMRAWQFADAGHDMFKSELATNTNAAWDSFEAWSFLAFSNHVPTLENKTLTGVLDHVLWDKPFLEQVYRQYNREIYKEEEVETDEDAWRQRNGLSVSESGEGKIYLGKKFSDILQKIKIPISLDNGFGTTHWIKRVSPVLNIVLPLSTENLSIPASFCMDRYMLHNAAKLNEMRKKQIECAKELQAVITEYLLSTSFWVHDSRQDKWIAADSIKLMEHNLTYLRGLAERTQNEKVKQSSPKKISQMERDLKLKTLQREGMSRCLVITNPCSEAFRWFFTDDAQS